MDSINLVEQIRQNLSVVKNRINIAAGRAGRDPASVTLVVVTKKHPVEVVQAAIDAGALNLGENYPEEASLKMAQFENRQEVCWHMIGHIQSRKAKWVTQGYHLIHSLDSLKLAQKLDGLISLNSPGQGQVLEVLLEYNVGGEGNKQGWDASDEQLWDDLLEDARQINRLPHLRVKGLMTMPPLGGQPEEVRQFFRRLARLRDFLTQRISTENWGELSMGTSADYEIAVQEGATLVRVGTAILGLRN